MAQLLCMYIVGKEHTRQFHREMTNDYQIKTLQFDREQQGICVSVIRLLLFSPPIDQFYLRPRLMWTTKDSQMCFVNNCSNLTESPKQWYDSVKFGLRLSLY